MRFVGYTLLCWTLCQGADIRWRVTRDLYTLDIFLNSNKQSIGAKNDITCAQIASRDAAIQSFCFRNNLCEISDAVALPISIIDDSGNNADKTCYTRSTDFSSRFLNSYDKFQ